GFDAGIGYSRELTVREVDAVPGFVRQLLNFMVPRYFRGDVYHRALDSRLRWSPESLTMSTSFNHQRSESRRFSGILISDADTAVKAIRSARQSLDNSAGIRFRPFENMTGSLSLT